MSGSRRIQRRSTRFQPWSDMLEGRMLLSGGGWPSYISTARLHALLHDPIGYPVVRPNTPVLPFGAPSKQAAFIDPSARIVNGYAVIVGSPALIAPYSTLNAQGGIIKIGKGSDILDNAAVIANPTHSHGRSAPEVLIGEQVLVGYGATILGPSTIGAYGTSGKPTEIGTGAQIEQATIEPGAIVGALARVGPGVTVPGGYAVLPGKNVTTNAEASDPSLGMVVPVTNSQMASLNRRLAANLQLAQGYNTLYQGQSVTGTNVGISLPTTNVYFGNLTMVTGSSPQPGSPTATTSFLPPGSNPSFRSPSGRMVQGDLYNFTSRMTGGVVFHARAKRVARSLGRSNSIRGDLGQPITFGSIARTGFGVTINSPGGGALTIGQSLVVGNNATILGDASTKVVLGDNVTIGDGAVVDGSSLGTGSSVGARALVVNSSFPAGTQIPAGAIYINNKLTGYVTW